MIYIKKLKIKLTRNPEELSIKHLSLQINDRCIIPLLDKSDKKICRHYIKTKVQHFLIC